MDRTKEEILKELKPKKINLKVDVFEEIILQDISQHDPEIRIKLNRDLTKEFIKWLMDKPEAKEQVKLSIKGETRSGKSLIALKIANLLTNYYKKPFDTDKIVCANQKELRQKLNKAEFGDTQVIDENSFANVGMGSMTELQQLKDINGIIAQENIHMIYITPSTFLNVGATLGLSYFGKDTKNWISRFLLYSLKGNVPQLLGYVVIDVGSLYSDNGCLVYREVGACTNPKRKLLNDIPKDLIKHSTCIPKDDKGNITDKDKLSNTDTNKCPLYDVCKSPLADYIRKKSKWIEREMKGGLGEREQEKMEVSIQLIKLLGDYDEDSQTFKIRAKNGKELKLKIKMKLPAINNTKYTGTEMEEIIQMVLSLTDLEFFKDVCKTLDIDFEKTFNDTIGSSDNNTNV